AGFDPDETQDLSRSVDQAPFLERNRRQAEDDRQRMLPGLQMEADENVVDDGAPGENAGLLECAHDSKRGDGAWPEAIEAPAAVHDVAPGGRQIAGDGVEGRGFARAV